MQREDNVNTQEDRRLHAKEGGQEQTPASQPSEEPTLPHIILDLYLPKVRQYISGVLATHFAMLRYGTLRRSVPKFCFIYLFSF